MLPVAPPRIKVREQHHSELGVVEIDEWGEADAAAIRALVKSPMTIEIIDGAGAVLAECINLIALRDFLGFYNRPSQILDPGLAYIAADYWTPCFGIGIGDLAAHEGEILSVVNFEQVDQEYGHIGFNTGYLICQSTSTSTRRPVWVEELRKVKEIVA
ncbi:hypothetical protein ACFU99_05805 [Streptomyces sp. NPDC057654]|uniref:hypothetical protein n=1 Tax=Streptomyces sp. NPDC057654 TaxID=3346196 RepID=UPI0036C5CB8C